MTEYTNTEVEELFAAVPTIVKSLGLGNGKMWLRLGSNAKEIKRCGQFQSINELVGVSSASMVKLFGQRWMKEGSTLR